VPDTVLCILAQPIKTSIPFKSGTHQISVPILLLASGGTTTKFRATLDSVESTHKFAHKSSTISKGAKSSMVVNVKDDSAAQELEEDKVIVEFTSTLSGVTRETFLATMATSYRQGVAQVSKVELNQVAITSVTQQSRRSSSIAVATAVSVPKASGGDVTKNIEDAHSSGNLASVIATKISEPPTSSTLHKCASIVPLRYTHACNPVSIHSSLPCNQLRGCPGTDT
jgi:hypothetical protein